MTPGAGRLFLLAVLTPWAAILIVAQMLLFPQQ